VTHPLRFGVMTSNAPDGRTWRERARRAEALGCSTLFMPDHVQEQWAPSIGLTIAAEATERLIVVPDDAIEAFAPVVERLAGQ